MSEYVKGYINENNLNQNVFMLGEINDPVLKKEYFAKSIVNISPNQAGLSVLESFSFGVPFVTKENAISGGEHLNIKHGYNGLLLKNEEELLEKMNNINDNIGQIRKMGENAYNYYVNNRNFNSMVEAFVNAIEYAINKS